MRRTLKKHTFLVIFRHVFPVEKSVPKIGVKNRPKKRGLQKVLEKLCSQLVLQPKNATLCAKNGVRMIAYEIRNVAIENLGRF